MYKGIAIFILSFSYTLTINGQSHNRYPSPIYQYYSDLKTINPAETALGQPWVLSVGNQALTGDFNNINNYYANLSAWISGHDTLSRTHGIGINFLGEREGSIFVNTRAYLSYALRLRLSMRYQMAVGASVGGINYVIQSTANSGGGSAGGVDARVGLCLYSTSVKLGVSVHQIPNSKLTPLVETVELQRYLELYGIHQWDISPQAKLKSMVHTRMLPHQRWSPDITELCLLNEAFAFGVSYTWLRRYGFIVGIQNIQLGPGKIQSYLAYYVPAGNFRISPNAGTIALTLSYHH
ncbi:MAG TPA: type IX secretion system membrane protein PorP/SprF [Cytophagales bacterium]|nr:type IX secretion system membrane protein PorP/SprF [Cytophagales bacterium]